MKKRILSVALALALCLTLLPSPALAAEEKHPGGDNEAAAVAVTAGDTSWDGGYFIVRDDITLNDRVTVKDNVTLILEKGKTLSAPMGILTTFNTSLTIEGGGTLEAICGENTMDQGIGYFGSITINGGTIIAESSPSMPGIEGKSITINGGAVYATGGSRAAGIKGDSVVINGGTVYATGGSGAADIEGTSFSTGTDGHAVIYADTISGFDGSSCDCIVFSGNEGTVYGHIALNEYLMLSGGQTLTVPDGASLEVNAGFDSYGTVRVEYGGTLTGIVGGSGEFFTGNVTAHEIVPPADPIYYNGQDQSELVASKSSLAETVEANGQTFQVDPTGWEPRVTAKDGGFMDYEIFFVRTDGGSAKIGPVEYTLEKTGTEFTGSGAMTTDKSEYTYGEAIAATALPSPTGAAPAAASLDGLAAPAANQMALFYRDTQVSEAVSMGEDGLFHMEATVKDLAAAGADYETPIPLTAKFAGNDYLAPAQAEVEITLHQKSVTARYIGPTEWEYNGQDGSGDFDACNGQPFVRFDGVLEGDSLEPAGFTFSLDSAGAGSRTLTITINGLSSPQTGVAENYILADSPATLTVPVTIKQKPVAESAVEVRLQSGPYPQGTQPGVWYVHVNDKIVPEETYEVTAWNSSVVGAGAGSLTVKSTDASNYSFTKTVTFDVACPHSQGLTEDSKCAQCGADLVGTATVNGTATNYFTLTELWNLPYYYTAGEIEIYVRKGGTTDIGMTVNGCAVTMSMDEGVEVSTNGRILVSVMDGGSFTLESGTLVTETKGNGCVQVTTGTVNIKGGTIRNTGSRGCALELYDMNIGDYHADYHADVQLSGCTLDAPTAIKISQTDATIGGCLAEGYAYKKEDGSWVMDEGVLGGKTLDGPVVVQPVPLQSVQARATTPEAVYGYGEADAPAMTVEADTPAGAEVSYQWLDGEKQAIAGATGQTYTEKTGLPAGTYTYYCQVSCQGFEEISDAVTCTVKRRPVTITAKGQEITFGQAIQQGTDWVEVFPLLAAGDTLGSVTLTKDEAAKTITPSAATITGGGGAVTGNYAIIYQTGVLTVHKAAITLEFPAADEVGLITCTYGETPALAVAKVDGQTVDVEIKYSYKRFAMGSIITGDGLPTDAGSYQITAAVEDTDIYGGAEAQATLRIEPKRVTNATATVSGTYTYTGEPIVPPAGAITVTYRDGNGETVTIPGSEYGIVIPDGANVNAGTCNFTIEAAGSGNYDIQGSAGQFTILPADIGGASVEVKGTYTYNGTAQTPAAADVQVTLNGRALAEGTDFTFTASDNENAGKATVTVTGRRNYTGEAAGGFTIQPAELTVAPGGDGYGAAASPYGPSLSQLSVSGPAVVLKSNGAAVPGTWKLSGDEVPEVGDEGPYTGTFQPSAGAGNYKRLEIPVKLTVSKASAASLRPEPGTLSVQNGQKREYQYNLTQLLPVLPKPLSLGGKIGFTVKAVDLKGGYYVKDEGAAITGSTLHLPIQEAASDKAEPIGTVTVTVQSQNFEDFDATLTVNSVNKATVTVRGVSVAGQTYNGESLKPTGTPAAVDHDGKATAVKGFTYTWKTADGKTLASAPVDAGSYILTVSVVEDDPDYTGSSDDIPVEIKQASITITAPSLEVYIGGTAPDLSEAVCKVDGLVGEDELAKQPTVSYASTPDTSKAGSVDIEAAGAAVPAGGNYEEAIVYITGTLTIRPKPAPSVPVSGVSLDQNALTLAIGESAVLTATVSPSNASNKNVTWTSGNPAVASVDSGTVTAVGVGTATITVVTHSGNYAASCTVTVKAKEYAVTYDANGGGGTMGGSTAIDGEAFVLPACGFTAPAGKVFDCWAIGSVGGERAKAGDSRTFTGDTTLYAIWKDAPLAVYTVAYDANGGGGTMDGGTVMDGEAFVLPACGFTAPAGKVFDCWAIGSADGPRLKPGDSYIFTKDSTVYAVWKDLPYHVTGVVIQNGSKISGAAVQLKQGPTVIAQQSTGADGSFTFTGITSGIYNLVVEKDGIIVTVMQPITSGSASLTITLPEGKTNSVVEIKGDTPPVIVGELETIFQDKTAYTSEDEAVVEAGGTVEFKLEVEKKGKADAGKIETIKPANQTLGLVLELTITKTVTTASDTKTSEVTEVGPLIETLIPLPTELQGKAGYAVYREHNGKAEALPSGGSGERYKVSADKTTITIFARKYSTYAIAWSDSPAPVNPGKPGNPGGPAGGSFNGGPSDSGYAVTVKKSEHGKVASSRVNAGSGDTVTLTVTPDSGYVLDTLTVTDSRGNELELTAKGDGKYTFTMPGRAVTVTAAFTPLPTGVERPCDGGADCPAYGFTDLDAGIWYHEAVDFVLRNGLMGGYGSGLFGPDDNLSRAQLAQTLYNYAGRPAVAGASPFTDAANGAWYTGAIIWAAAQGVVGGYGDGLFGPDDNITREQIAVMLWRYAGSPAAANKELRFHDIDEAGDYALEALRWAVENGILSGYGDGRLDPAGLATRAQAAAMLMRYMGDAQE